jgi:hypothetical protein
LIICWLQLLEKFFPLLNTPLTRCCDV